MRKNTHASAMSAPALFVPIAQLARRLGITPRALRHYQDQGLIRSHRIAHNTRAYDADAVVTIETIVALRDVGLPLATIRDILVLRHVPETQAQALRAALLEAKASKQRQIATIDAMLETLDAPRCPDADLRAEGDAPSWRHALAPAGLSGVTSPDPR